MFADGTQIVLASGNAGKAREFNARLAGTGWRIVTQSELGIAPAAETGRTFLENALLKARHASAESGLPALADDSGLSVAALRGEPGIHSARYAGEQASDRDNLQKLLGAMEELSERRAWFYCALVLLRHADDSTPLVATGRWDGRIARAPAGGSGFGYDPVFYVPELACTAAQLASEQKNRVSHRGKAIDALLAQVREV